MRDQIWKWQNMFKKEATRLCSHAAFITSSPMFGFDKIEVSNDVVLRELGRRKMVEMSKNKPHFLHIIAGSARRITLGIEKISKF